MKAKEKEKKLCREEMSERISKLNLTNVLFKRGMDITFLHESGPIHGKIIKIDKTKIYLWGVSDVLVLDDSHVHGWYVSHEDMLIILESMEKAEAEKADKLRILKEEADIKEAELSQLQEDPLYVKISKKYKIQRRFNSYALYRKGFFFWKAIHIHYGPNREGVEQKCQDLIIEEYNTEKALELNKRV